MDRLLLSCILRFAPVETFYTRCGSARRAYSTMTERGADSIWPRFDRENAVSYRSWKDSFKPMTKNTDKSPLSFEDALHELEQLVETLEKGELSLEQSLTTFERGVGLTKTCQKSLDEAEQKVRILTTKSVDGILEPFDTNE